MAELILEINNNRTSWKGVKFPFYFILDDGKIYKFTRSEFGCLKMSREDKKTNNVRFNENKLRELYKNYRGYGRFYYGDIMLEEEVMQDINENQFIKICKRYDANR